MPAYRFEALDANGKTSTGLLDADNARAARAQLRAQALVPLQVQPVAGGAGGGAPAGMARWRGRVFGSTALTVWTRQLAGLVSSGLPLERALTALADEAEDPRQRELVAHLRSEVNAGAAFARALGSAPREFDDVYRAVVAAGEQSGALGTVLERLADDLEERQALRARLLGATLYPAIVSLIAVVIVVFLVTYVVPQVASVFTSSKRALPALTVAMLAISDFTRHWGWLVLALLVAGGGGLMLALRNPGFRERFDAGWLRLPLLGRLARGYNAARFAGTLAMLAGAGVPILKALQAAAETLSNQAMRADALDALVQVREGAPLALALAAKKRFPGLLPMFARLGEQTGELPQMLSRAAAQLGAEVQRRALALATILEPLLIVGMGGVVMLIVLAVLLPIIQLNTWVK
ncbi:type II secretion system inner membrane protein GspF [Azohydromonas caseinilytica]|uniref:Type II secretion system inner membrane protein GspF n=1 Tax=Azohydromonas caseinilytica TaxID=2728836 RepID=A0A848F4F3_9BURK|nr:type II secretion system inner membrane protein GspF [Azohydromonas caseinilytica]NML13476.1 type II secretion system inner membrane protein GspF [Azohydromonas caseinilytica]